VSAGRVPVTLLAGLDAGDRAALVAHWLRTRPAGERWAVLAEGGLALAAALGEPGDAEGATGTTGTDAPGETGNGGGAVGVPAMAGAKPRDDVLVQPLGGCPCCSGATVLGVTLVRLLRQRRWDRILVAAGEGVQPAALLRRLREPGLVAAVEPAEVVVALDLRQADHWFDAQAGLGEGLRTRLAAATAVLLVGGDGAAARETSGAAPVPAPDPAPEHAPDARLRAALRAALHAPAGRRTVLACGPGAWPGWDAVRLPATP
jgi:hypothetical protein